MGGGLYWIHLLLTGHLLIATVASSPHSREYSSSPHDGTVHFSGRHRLDEQDIGKTGAVRHGRNPNLAREGGWVSVSGFYGILEAISVLVVTSSQRCDRPARTTVGLASQRWEQRGGETTIGASSKSCWFGEVTIASR